MARVKSPTTTNSNSKPMRPALDPDNREQQLIALAVDLVEQRLRDGTASAQETVHYLKLASSKTKVDLERAKLENELIRAKTQNLKDQADMKTLYMNAIEAMKRYSGHGSSNAEEDEYDEY